MKTQCKYGLKGQKALSPGHRPGYNDEGKLALKGQKPFLSIMLLPLAGCWLHTTFTQGVALGYVLSGLSGRFAELAEVNM